MTGTSKHVLPRRVPSHMFHCYKYVYRQESPRAVSLSICLFGSLRVGEQTRFMSNVENRIVSILYLGHI